MQAENTPLGQRQDERRANDQVVQEREVPRQTVAEPTDLATGALDGDRVAARCLEHSPSGVFPGDQATLLVGQPGPIVEANR
jgi:hypothetical protein